MPQKSRGGLFRTRNILGAALIAGIALGIYLGQWKGFGLGGGWGLGTGDGETHVSLNPTGDSIQKLHTLESKPEKNDAPAVQVPEVVRIVIDDEKYFLRQANDGSKDLPMTLPDLIRLIEQAPGDADGLRVRVYEKLTARAEAEENLKKELANAGVPDAAIFWVPTPLE